MTNTEQTRTNERFSVTLVPPAQDALEAVTSRTHASKNDVVNRALQLYAFLDDVQARDGRVYIQEKGEEQLSRIKFF
jgi:hypothetical protein